MHLSHEAVEAIRGAESHHVLVTVIHWLDDFDPAENLPATTETQSLVPCSHKLTTIGG